MSDEPIETDDNDDELDINLDHLEWRDLFLCHGMDTNMFFDDYESDEQVAKVVDELCLSCPVVKQCLQDGVENKDWGVWGGVFLISGKPNEARNAHKTPEFWSELRLRIDE